MTRLELLHLLVSRARSNGFEFRRWYTSRLDLPWISSDAALALLAAQRRYYALVFSHDFAQHFWKAGTDISFDVPSRSFQRTNPDGTVGTVQRKAHIRRSTRPNAWRYHLRQMALAEEPLRYLRKFLHVEEDLDQEPEAQPVRAEKTTSRGGETGGKSRTPAKKRAPRPLPTGLPAFLQRPYRPTRK